MAADLLVFNPTIDLGQLATIGVALGGGIWFASRTLASVTGIKNDMQIVKDAQRDQGAELKKITDILVKQAGFEARQSAQELRLANVEAEQSRLRAARD
jgi:hypothetical protein